MQRSMIALFISTLLFVTLLSPQLALANPMTHVDAYELGEVIPINAHDSSMLGVLQAKIRLEKGHKYLLTSDLKVDSEYTITLVSPFSTEEYKLKTADIRMTTLGGNDGTAYFTPAVTGYYYIAIPVLGWLHGDNTQTITITDTHETEIVNGGYTMDLPGQSIGQDEIVSGILTTEEHSYDIITVSLQKDEPITIYRLAGDIYVRVLDDSYTTVYDQRNIQMRSLIWQPGQVSTVDYTPQKTGIHHIVVTHDALRYYTSYSLKITGLFAKVDTVPVERIFGPDRYRTAGLIFNTYWLANPSDSAILVNGENFPDALAAAPLAYKLKAPILLTTPHSLSAYAGDKIKEMNAKNVYIIGGEGVVSKGIEDQLSAQGLKVTRYGGVDRFETSKKVAEVLGNQEQAIVVNGLDFKNALVISSWAAQNGVPILLTAPSSLPNATKNALARLGTSKTLVIGDQAEVSEAVFKQLPSPDRIEGTSLYDTFAKVSQKYFANPEVIYMASSNVFADALTGSVIAAIDKAPILIVDKNDSESIKQYNSYLSSIHPKLIKVLGGEGAVTSSSVIEAEKLLGMK